MEGWQIGNEGGFRARRPVRRRRARHLIFSGTPSGVGMGRTPPRYLAAGDVLESTIEGIGTIVTTFR